MSETTPRRKLYYTFGNHMHWVDMEWLWGYEVLPGSVSDMLRLAGEAGVKGNVNFDAIGFEKLAAEAPEAMHYLKEAVREGRIEVVGGSYGQPYGLFHGGESNVRQLIYGVRAVKRHFGVRPRAFWEEEFYFFPQLPQMLRRTGYSGACLFFQWTWHTPAMPEEARSLVIWEGIDGSRLPAVPRQALCLHQWPEDFAGLLDSKALSGVKDPAIVQWLELMPSKDWMCRAELLLPKLIELRADPRFEIEPVTLTELIDRIGTGSAPVRRYGMDDVFHGMSLGKNNDRLRRRSASIERRIEAASALSATAGLLGRPYAFFDVYPIWEIDEAWRELLSAQHHDNDECEGLCGHIGEMSYARSDALAASVLSRVVQHLSARSGASRGSIVVFNELGWSRDVVVGSRLVRGVPPFGYKVVAGDGGEQPHPPATCRDGADDDTTLLVRGAIEVTVDRRRGVVTRIVSPDFPDGLAFANGGAGDISAMLAGKHVAPKPIACRTDQRTGSGACLTFVREFGDGYGGETVISLARHLDAVEIHHRFALLPRPDAGMHGGYRTALEPSIDGFEIVHDTPYSVQKVVGRGTHVRKYPTGDWLTSPQVFEKIVNPFTALTFADLTTEERGLLYVHGGCQAFFRGDRGILHLLNMYDPWDEDYWHPAIDVKLFLLPHGRITHAARWRLAQEIDREPLVAAPQPNGPGTSGGGDWRSPVTVEPEGVIATAFYRECEASGAGFPAYAGLWMGHPFVLRLVEMNGEAADVRLRFQGEVARAVRTNLLGEAEADLRVIGEGGTPPRSSEVRFRMEPREIATVYADLVLGRKVARHLDDYRKVWATVHKEAVADGPSTSS